MQADAVDDSSNLTFSCSDDRVQALTALQCARFSQLSSDEVQCTDAPMAGWQHSGAGSGSMCRVHTHDFNRVPLDRLCLSITALCWTGSPFGPLAKAWSVGHRNASKVQRSKLQQL